MKRKGFTLFTALVAFVLIFLSILLVQTMIKTERDRQSMIENAAEQSRMQALADLERADALQVFNYYMRHDIEYYLKAQDTGIGPISIEKSWDEIIEDFAVSFFAGGARDADGNPVSGQLANYAADNLTNLLDTKRTIGVYYIEIVSGTGEERSQYRDTMVPILAELFKTSVEEGKFFEVVECENGNPNGCIGTFYINLLIENLSQENYEKLPQIKITNLRTGRILKESILPKTNLKLFVPIRFFRALALTRAIAIEYGKDWGENYGLFAPRIHNEIEEMRLGMCDYGYCNPRDNPYIPPLEKYRLNALCPSGLDPLAGFGGSTPQERFPLVTIQCTEALKSMGVCDANISYDPGSPTGPDGAGHDQKRVGMKTVLKDLVEHRLKFVAGEIIEENKEEFIQHPFHLNDVKITVSRVDADPAKKIESNFKERSSFSGERGTDFSDFMPNHPFRHGPCPMRKDFTKPNFSLNGGVGVLVGLVEGEETIIEPDFAGVSDLGCSGISGSVAQCVEVEEVTVLLTFEETDEKYIVDFSNNETPKYKIKIVDGRYTGFAPAYNARLNPTTCALDGEPRRINCSASGWNCISVAKLVGGDGLPLGCNKYP